MKTNIKLYALGALIFLTFFFIFSFFAGQESIKGTPEYKAGVAFVTKENAEKAIEEAQATIQANEKVIEEVEDFLTD